MTTRRQVLSGVGSATLAAFAGCNGLPTSNTAEEDQLTEAELAGWTPDDPIVPGSLPFSVPDSLRETHRNRSAELLDEIPVDPDVPNGAVETRLRNDRAAVQQEVSDGSDAMQPLEILDDWRWIRSEVAALFGAYRAATGTDDGKLVENRRQTLRTDTSALKSQIDYSAQSPRESVLVYALIEDHLQVAYSHSQPHNHYPDHPESSVELAGEVFQAVEQGVAALADASGLLEAYISNRNDTETHWECLLDSAKRIDYAVNRTRARRVPEVEYTEPETIFDKELSTMERELYRQARHEFVRDEDRVRDHRTDGRPATAILTGGRILASIAAFEAVIEAIESDRISEQPTAKSLKRIATEARDAIWSVQSAEYPYLSGAILEPAVTSYRAAVRNLRSDIFDVEHALVSFHQSFLYASAVPSAASFLADHLEK